jgi:hypothetical protein
MTYTKICSFKTDNFVWHTVLDTAFQLQFDRQIDFQLHESNIMHIFH